MRYLFTLFAFVAIITIHASPIVYSAPAGSPLSNRYTVQVREGGGVWQSVPVYDFWDQRTYNQALTTEYHVAYFVASGNVEVRAEASSNIGSYDLRPKSQDFNESFSSSNDRLDLTLTANRREAWVEFDGGKRQPLVIISQPPSSAPAGAIVYGAGWHEMGKRTMGSNQTIYISGGAVVHGYIEALGKHDIKICGPGILWTSTGHIQIKWGDDCYNTEIRDIIGIKQGENWAVWQHESHNMDIINYHLFTEIRDGVDPINAQDVLMDGCLIAAHDDTISPKGNGWGGYEPCEDITVKNSILSNAGGGNVLRIGSESNTERFANITFENCDVLHSLPNGATPDPAWPEAVFTIGTTADIDKTDAPVDGVFFRDLRVENNEDDFLFDIRHPSDNAYQEVTNVTVEDVRVTHGAWKGSRVHGQDDAWVRNVHFDSLYKFGTLIGSAADGNIDINGFTESIIVGSAGNLLADGDFESGDLSSWSKIGSFSSTSSNVYEGAYACQVSTQSGWPKLFQAVAAVPNQEYAFSAYIKTALTSGSTQLLVECFDSSGTRLSFHWGSSSSGTTAYHLETVTFTTPANTSTIKTYIHSGNPTGTSWFDSVMLQKTTENLLANQGFELGTLDRWSSIGSFGITTTPVYSGTYAVEASTQSGWPKLYQQVSALPSTNYSFSAEISTALTSGAARLLLETFDASGTRLSYQWGDTSTGTTAYHRESMSLTTPANTATIKAYLHMSNPTGQAWADELTLYQE